MSQGRVSSYESLKAITLFAIADSKRKVLAVTLRHTLSRGREARSTEIWSLFSERNKMLASISRGSTMPVRVAVLGCIHAVLACIRSLFFVTTCLPETIMR